MTDFDDRPLWEQQLAEDPDDAEHEDDILYEYDQRVSDDEWRIRRVSWQRHDAEADAAAQGKTLREIFLEDFSHPAAQMDYAVYRRGACRHCNEDPVRYGDGLCSPCHIYLTKYHVLPSADLIRKRLDRRVAKGARLRSYTDR